MPTFSEVKIHGFITFKSIDDLEKEANDYGFSLIERAQDTKRPNYIFLILSPRLK